MTRFKKSLRRNRPSYFGKKIGLVFGAIAVLSVGSYFTLPPLFKTTYAPSLPAAVETAVLPEPPKVVHLPTPEPLKAIYMTSCVAGTPSFRADLVALTEKTELNSIVIDIKDWSGGLSFIPRDAGLQTFVSNRCLAPDMEDFITLLHGKGIYVIGRITVFQDPLLASRRPDLAVKKKSDGTLWEDYKGLHYLDPGAKEAWEHVALIAKESYAIGFDELNFDYIRFPSDGPMNDIAFPWSGNRAKAEVLEDFFSYLSSVLRPLGAILSADVFGMTTSNSDDLNIGQVLERIEPYFDYVAPMVYPSHYPPHFRGLDNPNHYPYEVVNFSMATAVKRFRATTTLVTLRGVTPFASTTPPLYPKKVSDTKKLRPWLQDFDYGGNYDIPEVQAQIQATYDAGLTSWMLWAPSNRYTRGALLPE